MQQTKLPFQAVSYLSELDFLQQSKILELLPVATVIYKRDTDALLHANQKFYELTRFSEDELFGMQLSDIIPYETDTNITSTNARPTAIRIANGDILQTAMRVTSINLTNTVVLLAFYPPDLEANEQKEPSEFQMPLMMDHFTMLSQLGEQNSSKSLLFATANIVKSVLNAPITALYLPQDSENGAFTKANLPETFNCQQLPQKISMGTGQLPVYDFLWLTDSVPQHMLHEFTLAKDYSYAVILPVRDENHCHAVIYATGITPTPTVETMRFLSLLANQSVSILAKIHALENATKRLNTMRHIVQIERGITENMNEGLIVLTPDLRIAEMNSAAEIILGYASKEVFLEDIEMVLIGNENLATHYKSAQQGISTIAGTNLMLNDRRGNAFPAQLTCVPIILDGEVKSIIILLRDLSQTEQLLQHSKQLEQRAFLGEVSAVFAHEVKNPINSISTGLQFMGMNMKPEDPHYNLVMRLQQDCQRLTHLTDSTLTFAKPVEYQPLPMNISALLENILERWAPRMTRLNINYLFESEPKNAIVLADGRAIEQVFVNLISNSIQAMDSEGGTLSIQISPAQDSQPPQYEITVADSGPGIPDDIIKHIFEPFQTTKTTGTGLGLAITKRIVTAHKGYIFVESFPGGTMFRVLLPMADIKEKNDN